LRCDGLRHRARSAHQLGGRAVPGGPRGGATGLSRERVLALVDRRTEQPLFGFLGEARVNVLLLNLDVDDARTR